MTEPSFVNDGGPTFAATCALREACRERYWHEHDPILDDRLLWRAQTFCHTVHLLPGQTVLELGCGSGRFTRALRRVSRGENPITAATFLDADVEADLVDLAGVEHVRLSALPGALGGRRFDFIVAMDLADHANVAALLALARDLLEPGGELLLYESNPWNPVHKLRWAWSRVIGPRDPRRLLNPPQLRAALAAAGFEQVSVVFNDFVFAPLTPRLIWWLRNLSIVLENTPLVRAGAGSILLHAQRPPAVRAPRAVSLATHAFLRGAISVVIPCRNEEMNVVPLVTRLFALYGDYLHEVVLVDDGSTDATRDRLVELAVVHPRVKPLLRAPPHGVGRAIRDGLSATTGRWVLTMDCDFQHLLPEFRELFDVAASGFDVVVGSRFSRHSVLLNYPFAKIIANRAFHALVRLFFHPLARDLTNNLKLIRREVVEKLHLRQPGFAVNAETGLQPLFLGYRVAEVPISWINRTPGMGVSSFRLARVGGGYCAVLRDLWLKRTFNAGPYRGLDTRRGLREPRGHASGGLAPRRTPQQTRMRWLGWGTIFLLAALLRVGFVERHGLWGDEIFSLAMATGHSLEHAPSIADPAHGDYVDPNGPVTVAELRRYIEHGDPPASLTTVARAVRRSDTSPPLYYLVLHGWTRWFGTSDFALRSLSVFLSLACLPLLAGVATRVGGARIAALACLLFAVSPFGIYYSAEGRMYSLLWFCVLATVFFTLVLRLRGGRNIFAPLWVVASIAGFFTHYFFLFPWVACALFLLLRPGRLRRTLLAVLVLVTLIAIAPWYAQVPASMNEWRLTSGWLKMRPGGFEPVSAAIRFGFGFFTGHNNAVLAHYPRAVWGAGVMFGLAAIMMACRWRWRIFAGRRLFIWLWFLAAWSGPLVLDAVQGTYLVSQNRYASAALPAACLLGALALGCFSWRIRVILVLGVLVCWGRYTVGAYALPSRSGSPIRDLAAEVSRAAAASDVVLVHSIPSGVLGFARYAETEAPITTWIGQLENRRVPESIAALVAGRTSVWFVRLHDVGQPAPELDWLRQHAQVAREFLVADLLPVVQFRPREGDGF